MSPRRYVFNLLIAIDQLANTVLAGNPDETISSRAHKAVLKSRQTGKTWGCVLCRILDLVDPNHCAKSVELDEI